jgi:hypothetical protein
VHSLPYKNNQKLPRLSFPAGSLQSLIKTQSDEASIPPD